MWEWESERQPKAVVAIIHSAYEHHRRYAWLIEKFRSSGFHVVMGDLPGHGEYSQDKNVHDENFDLYSSYIKQLVQVSMTHNLPVFVLGHGLGATLLMHALQEKSIECAGVILTSPWLQLKKQPSKLSTALSSMGKLTDNVKSVHEITIKQLTRNYDVYMQEKDDPYYHTTVTLKWYKDLQQLMKQIGSNSEFIQDVPVLMMTAERDKVSDITHSQHWLVRQKISELQYKEWKNCYHDLFHEPEREDVFYYTESFMHNSLRSLGYII
ncbi:MAG: alpha/beta hydrolase [Paenisporosarcina sp.]